VATASKVEPLIAMLERNIEKLKIPAGEPLIKPDTQSKPPASESDSLLLHLTARNLIRKGNEYVIPQVKLGETKSGNWGAYPAEDWIRLKREEWRPFLPAGAVRPGTVWEIDPKTAAVVLNHFYPATENNDIRTNRIERQTLKATALRVENGVIRARLDGSLKMKHPFYHKDDDQFVEATVVGIVEFEPSTEKIRSLQLVTDQAIYGRRDFGVAVRSVP
jgi:hypothetical protein